MNKEHTFFAAIKTDMHLEKFWARLGLGHVSPNFSIWNRMEKNFKNDYSLSTTSSYQHGPFYLSIANIINITNKSL